MYPGLVYAGRIYGSVTAEGKGLANTAIEIDCAGTVTKGATAADGSYRIDVTTQGKCTFTLTAHPGRPSAVVFSYPDPSQYDFEVVKADGKVRLRRR
jgi:hypothetical protein